MYLLTCEEIVEYATAIVNQLGWVIPVRDAEYGGTEYCYQNYNGFGFSITKGNGGGGLIIEYDEEAVYRAVDTYYYPGEWEVLLKELYDSIPRLLAKGEEWRKRQEEDKNFIEDCKKYLLKWKWCSAPGGDYKYGTYDDGVISITAYDYKLRFYKKVKSFWNERLELIYDNQQSHHGARDLFPKEWREYLECRIREKKNEARIKEKREEEEKRVRAAESFRDRMDKLHDL